MDTELGHKAGKLVVRKIGMNITLLLFYDTKTELAQPSQQIPILPAELDALCSWWKANKSSPSQQGGKG